MEPLRKTFQSMYANTKAAYDKIDEMGGELPTNKNLQNLAGAILSIPTGPSLNGLKRALDAGTAQQDYPPGTTLDDQYDGKDNPLIVAQYLDATNNSAYGGAEGVILVRKYIYPYNSQIFGANADYIGSSLQNFLNNEYYNNCSDVLKKMLSDITIQVSSTTATGQKFFAMSVTEVGGSKSPAEGIFWEYWKYKTNLVSPSNSANNGRICYGLDGIARSLWLRTKYNASNVQIISFSGGAIGYTSRDVTSSILPACFIGKD